jgi:hypothetical protein
MVSLPDGEAALVGALADIPEGPGVPAAASSA